MTRSTGTSGLILSGSPPISTIALRREAKSTTAGTPVKSCKITRDGLKGTSVFAPSFVPHFASPSTCSSLITFPSY